MALRISTALRNHINSGGSLRQALNGGTIQFRTGPQPTAANDAVQGTLLCTFTKSGASHTNEVLAQGTVTFSGTVTGASCTGITVNSIQIMGSTFTDATTVLADFAAGVAAIINKNPLNLLYTASAALGVVTLTAKPGLGASVNGHVVVSAVTTISKSDVNIGTTTTGVTQVNGLTWEKSAAGVMLKNTAETWQGTAAADGTAGWFRWVAAVADAGSADANEVYMRLDGVVAASGGELNGATAIVNGAVQTISADQFTIPAA